MRVAPIDIAHKTFGRKIYGLDTEEVYDFLRDIADEMEEVVRSHNQLEEKLKEKERSLGDLKEREESLKQTLQTASQMSERMRSEAEKEAELIVRDARQRSEIIIKEARDSLRKMYQEINDLKKSRLQFEAGLKLSGFSKTYFISSTYEEELALKIASVLEQQDIVVVKGSRGMKLERVIQAWKPLNFNFSQ